MYKYFSSEKKIFKKYAKVIYKSPKVFDREKILKSWMNEVLNFYKRSHPKANTFFIEQFFLFDDEYTLYKWFDFDKLILFIRDPYYQLQSTLESKILYSNYPWQAQFIIGGGSKFDLRKYELFIETTKLRYQWIIKFLKNYEKDKIIIVDFDDFINNYEQTIKFLSKKLEIDLQHKSKFNIMDSRKRNKKWQNTNYNLDFKLNLISKSFIDFKKDLSRIATTIS